MLGVVFLDLDFRKSEVFFRLNEKTWAVSSEQKANFQNGLDRI